MMKTTIIDAAGLGIDGGVGTVACEPMGFGEEHKGWPYPGHIPGGIGEG